MTTSHAPLPSLDQAITQVHEVERRFSVDTRVAQTRAALAANERLTSDRSRVGRYFAYLGERDMYRPIYGMGHFPHGLPVALPPYLMEILDASARALMAFMRHQLHVGGPAYLVDRMPKGWLTDEMAERLTAYYLTTEPDMAFDVLVHGAHAKRDVTFEEFKRSGDYLHAKILEAQSVDTYYGWFREYLKGSRLIGLGAGHNFTRDFGPDGSRADDATLERQTLAALNYPLSDDPGAIFFLEVDPELQASGQNLVFMAQAMSGFDPARQPLVLDPRDIEIRDGRVYSTKKGFERELKKGISRIVEVDLAAYVKAREAEGATHVIERFKQLYAMPQLWGDLSKHVMGFYLVNKIMLTELAQVASAPLSVMSPTARITPERLAALRANPARLQEIAIKPLLGMSAKGVIVDPTLEELERSVEHEAMLMQDLFWATPVLPDINTDIADPDVRAGVCCEARLVMHGGSPAVPHNPHRARTIAGLSRSHYQSADPRRRIKGDSAGRGWYSNMGAILAVKRELGISDKKDTGVGMAPIYWLD
jgi:hypothetical protein